MTALPTGHECSKEKGAVPPANSAPHDVKHPPLRLSNGRGRPMAAGHAHPLQLAHPFNPTLIRVVNKQTLCVGRACKYLKN